MGRKRFWEGARRELRGIAAMGLVLVIALSALFLPWASVAQAGALTRFSSPPPGTPRVLIRIPRNGQLLDGIEARTLVTISCGPFTQLYGTPSVSFTVSQVDLGKVNVASGYLTPNLVCDNVPHLYAATATLTAGETPFHLGPALAQLSIDACGYGENGQYTCAQGNASSNLDLR